MRSLVVLMLVVSATAFGQVQDSLNMKAQPIGGKAVLQLVYYRIDFTQEETDYLRSHAPELIFSVTDKGVPKLEKVNDMQMQSIIDSMMRVNDRLPAFYPEKVNGRAETGVYFLKLAWPNYQAPSLLGAPFQHIQFYDPVRRKLSEFSEITYRGPRYDMVFAGFAANLSGNLGRSTRAWGTKFDFMIYGNKGWGGGFGTTTIFAKRARPGPTTVGPDTKVITFVSGIFGKLFREGSLGQLSLQIEPAFAITGSSDYDPSGPALGVGFSPGASAIFMVPLGPGRMSRQYFLPTSYRHYLSFQFTARTLLMNTERAEGNVLEFGLAYRLASRPVANYKLKE